MKKPKKSSRKSSFLHLAKISFSLLITSVLAAYIYFNLGLPSIFSLDKIPIPASTLILARDGSLLYEIHGERRRLILSYGTIPKNVINATLATEDKNFYRHFGVDPFRLLKALVVNLQSGKILQGGSTITMQLAKNRYLDSRQTVTRKIKEIILASKLELKYSKKQILTFYLNEAPYGSNAYGIESAARLYFDKHAEDLNLAETAALAALPKAPTVYSPYGQNMELLLWRKDNILEQMTKLGMITNQELSEAKAQKLTFVPRRESITAPHFVMYVREKLVEEFGEDEVEKGGLVVRTTLDPAIQAKVEEVTSQSGKILRKVGASNLSAVVTAPQTGQVLAMVGSRDFFDSRIEGQVNTATALRQPGSSIKPLIYATAFDNGLSPASVFFDLPTSFGDQLSRKPYRPQNYDGQFRGAINLRTALANSLNIPSVKVLALTGLDKFLDKAEEIGITTLKDRKQFGLSLVLGGGDIKLVELTGAYGALANQGKFVEVSPFLEIKKEGEVLKTFDDKKSQQVFSGEAAFQVTDILTDKKARRPVFGFIKTLEVPEHQVAVKTGTTQKYRDAWTIGYTPDLAVGVWVGNNYNRSLVRGSAGAIAAAPIWQGIFKKLLEGQSPTDFKRPDSLSEYTVSTSIGRHKEWLASWQIIERKNRLFAQNEIDFKPYWLKTYTLVKKEEPPKPPEETPESSEPPQESPKPSQETPQPQPQPTTN